MDEIHKTRQRACCPKCDRVTIAYDKKTHLMHCHNCGAEWHKSKTAYVECKCYSYMPKYLSDIMKRKEQKKAELERSLEVA
jgi:ribosomal protein L37AE/L43A